jgi:hypothetical protein
MLMRSFILSALLATAQTVFVIPTRAYTGTITTPATNVPVGATGMGVNLDISQMTDPTTSFECNFDTSYDDGASWQHWNGAGRSGGPVPVDRFGNPRTTASFGGPLPAIATASTKLRGICEIVGTITTGGTVQVVF